MRGDFSRNTHRPNRHYSRVLLQQGRVIVDADWNEQVDLQVQALRQVLGDLIGPHGGPSSALGFFVERGEPRNGKLVLEVTNSAHVEGAPASPEIGRYYVDGIQVEHSKSTVETGLDKDATVFVYLEVWERHLTWIEENADFKDGSMREVALGGPDTASRMQVRWAIRSEQVQNGRDESGRPIGISDNWVAERLKALGTQELVLAAGLTTQDIGVGDPCRDSAQPRYRGPENRLYRVEIHEVTADGPTFKWSRENGSVVFPIDVADEAVKFEGGRLTLALGLGRDPRYTLARGDIVEFVTAEFDEAGVAGPLLEVIGVDEVERSVELRPFTQGLSLPLGKWALLRRWEQPISPRKDSGIPAKLVRGAILIDGRDKFVLEEGIVVQFSVAIDEAANEEVVVIKSKCRVGDYWLIPARTIPGDVEWPSETTFALPHGVARHFAPLAVVIEGNGGVRDLRRHFGGLAQGVLGG